MDERSRDAVQVNAYFQAKKHSKASAQAHVAKFLVRLNNREDNQRQPGSVLLHHLFLLHSGSFAFMYWYSCF